MPPIKPTRLVLELASKPQEITKVEKFLERVNGIVQLEESRYNKLLVAATEAVNNGIIHGNKRDPAKKVVITCEIDEMSLVVHVRDEGSGVNPDKLPDPLAEENLLRENGRGVFLMRSLMDEVTFAKFSNGSEVTMKMILQN